MSDVDRPGHSTERHSADRALRQVRSHKDSSADVHAKFKAVVDIESRLVRRAGVLLHAPFRWPIGYWDPTRRRIGLHHRGTVQDGEELTDLASLHAIGVEGLRRPAGPRSTGHRSEVSFAEWSAGRRQGVGDER